MRWGWPFLLYPPVVLLHLGMLTFAAPGSGFTKALLMSALLLAVVLTATVSARRGLFPEGESRSARRGVVIVVLLLSLGIVASWFGDVLVGSSFIAGLGSFALAHLLYIAAFNGPAASRRIPLWTLGYPLVLIVALAVLWPHFGDLQLIVLGYGVVLALTAMTSARVSGLTALGGGLFLASDALLAFRIFQPDFRTVFPDPWQDLTIMVPYCAGEGLIALGLLRHFAGRGTRAGV